MLTEKGYVLEKHKFEQWLCSEAVKKGASLHLSHRVTGMERIAIAKNEFVNWKIDGKGNEFPIECKAVIDASGVTGAATKLLNMGTEVEVIAGFHMR